MSDSDATADIGGRADGRQQGRQKVESWVPVTLKADAEDRADDLDVPMAEYLRRLLRADVYEHEEIEA